MKRPLFIARQSARPSGLIGSVIGRIMAHETAKLNERAVDLLAPSRSDRVLEIGFGHGRTIERLAGIVGDGHVSGVDVSDAMLAMALRRNRRGVAAGRIDLSVADCATLPFGAASFDGALSVHTLYFWRDPVSGLREIRRVLRPSGRFVLGFLRAESALCAGFPGEVYSFYREGEVEAMLAEAGFEAAQFARVGEVSLALARAAAGSV